MKDQSEKPIGREQRKLIQSQKVIRYPNSLANALLHLLPARKMKILGDCSSSPGQKACYPKKQQTDREA